MELVDNSSDEEKQIDKQYQLDREIRGSILEQAITIEGFVEDIIATHFCPDLERRYLLHSLIISTPHLGFPSKVKILKGLLRICYPDLLQNFPDVIDELDKVRRFRNRIAHSALDTTPEWLANKFTDRIRLVYYKDGRREQQVVTLDDIKEKQIAFSRLIPVLLDIWGEVGRRISAKRT